MTGRFRIRYEVTATTAGATRFFNPIRKRSVATDEAVSDRLTGRPLPFTIVGGGDASAVGVAEADRSEQHIAAQLPRPVSPEGGVRLLIQKTYPDAKSYFVEVNHSVFSRPLGTFDLYYDYTEVREGTDRYLNVVRKGSTVSNPAARILDTGEPLKAEVLRGGSSRPPASTSVSRSGPTARSCWCASRRWCEG